MFADRVIMMKHGRIACDGTPKQALTTAAVNRVFDLAIEVSRIPAGDAPFLLPQAVASLGNASAE
jgi:iron complex transport system ATP-binding protein